ncbi:GbsR/MarR family transcriptional regulator [Bacillus infantis]|uniref:HTH-type transcriptional regulator n=1 Tax=Bacillus infantis TaxID=324767 RepID=A0A5D4R7T4_9BACI|nr:GbsR/MarR family transcriptional regulator [Bacillus infantis]TYS45652.1 GbsR/MarR family transcriptional regulator [Bacillus infantis]
MHNEELVAQARERVIESVARNMHLYGVPASIGRIYGTLYFENKPMTLDELKEELEMSKTSMSTGVRTLLELNMVEKVWRKGERKDLYQVKGDWYQNFIDRFCTQWRKGTQMNLDASLRSLKDLEEVLSHTEDDETVKKAENHLQKITYAIEYYTWLDKVIDLFESREIFELTKSEDEKKEE